MTKQNSKTKKSTNSKKYEHVNRRFSEEFKRIKVQKLVKKELSIQQLCDLYEISRTTAYNWLYKYSTLEKGTRMVMEMESEGSKMQQLLEKVSELERVIGQKQLEIDYLDQTLNFASKEVGFDLKKKYAPGLSNGLNLR